MNRSIVVRALAACETLAGKLREALNADARAEFEEQGTAPTYRMPGYTVSASLSKPSAHVSDETAWRKWVKFAYPAAVIEVVNPAWQKDFLAKALARALDSGLPLADADGTVLPGVEIAPGGQIRAVAVKPTPQEKAALERVADDIVAGRRPLALPSTVDGALAGFGLVPVEHAAAPEGIEPVDLETVPRIDDLIEASSLGTPEARALRAEGKRLLSADLTGMPEEQADWEADGA